MSIPRDGDNPPIPTGIPMSGEYTALLGQAAYAFDYYEGTILSIVHYVDPKYRIHYFRELSLTSGALLNDLRQKFRGKRFKHKQYREDLLACLDEFNNLIELRNALMHAHPCNDPLEGPILFYQADVEKPIHDKRWGRKDIIEFVGEIEKAEVFAAGIYDKIAKELSD